METIAWYKNQDGLFFIRKVEKKCLIFYFCFLSIFLLFFLFPFPSYQHHVGTVSKDKIVFSIPMRDLSYIEESTLSIKGKKYDFAVIAKEEREGSYLITIQIFSPFFSKHKVLEMVYKGKRKSKMAQCMETLRKEWFLSRN